MADRLDYYFRQRVSEAELDLAFELLEKADRNLAADIGVFGVITGAEPAPHSPIADLTIDLTAPGRAYDRLGQRIFFGTGQRVDCAVDDSGIPTEITVAGKERWLGVFLRFDRLLSDPRTDGNSQQVYFRRDESFELVVRQGPEANVGVAPKVPLQQDELLVCDVLRRHGQTQIIAGDLDTSRRQAFIFATGDAVQIVSGTWTAIAPAVETVQAALDSADALLAGHFAGTASKHSAADINSTPHGFVAATNVQATLDELVDDLSSAVAGAPGASRVGADAVAGTPNALPAGNVDGQISQLLAWLNAHVGAVTGAHNASAIAATAHNNISGVNVQSQLQEIVTDLAATGAGSVGSTLVGVDAVAGAPNAMPAGTVRAGLAALLGFINAHLNQASGAHAASAISFAGGPAWADGTTNPATDVQTQLDKIVSELAATAGGGRVGYAAPVGESLATNSVKGGLDRAATRGLRRNFVHNGNFCVWRRNGNYATSDVTFAPTRTYLVDRWYLVSNNGSSGNGQVDLYPLIDGGSLEKSGLVLNKYGTGTNEVSLTQEIERVDVQHLAGRTVGLSFSVGRPSYRPAGGTFKVLLIAGTGSTGQVLTTPYTGQTTVIDSGPITPPLASFQTYSFTGTVPANATTLAVKVSYVPNGNSTGEIINLQWLSLAIGAPATEFDYASGSRAGEYDLCRYYYENSYENGGLAVPGYSNGRVGFGISLPSNGNSANSNFLVGVLRMQDKRARPTIRLWAIGFWGDTPGRLSTAPLGGSVNASFACTAASIGSNEFELYVPMGASPALDLSGNKTIYGEWDADADY